MGPSYAGLPAYSPAYNYNMGFNPAVNYGWNPNYRYGWNGWNGLPNGVGYGFPGGVLPNVNNGFYYRK